MIKHLFGLIILTFLVGCEHSKPVFELLDAQYTGVDFSNEIIENDSINILTFDYTYNGGGVALADYNNDGLKDIFFSANMVDNRLYLNKGEMKFEDITEVAGLIGFKQWCTAAIAVDINTDGLMDIYVPVSSTKGTAAEMRQNLLFVNQGLDNNGVPSFKEQGKEYGVNDDGFSEGAAFFDYDNDGDLDLYVLTNVIDQNPNLIRPKVVDGSYPNTDRLYRNDASVESAHPVFVNVSGEAGITIEGFGLGLNVVDIDRDGWKDIYVTNDYAADDLLYRNNQDGTFTNVARKYFKHTSNSAMGNDIADINNDGLVDIVALDMMPQANVRKKMFAPDNSTELYRRSDQHGYTYQHMRNTLQLNSGRGESFQEIGLLAGVSETDWSWTPSLADFDNDGYRDLLVTNGFPKDVTDKDFMTYRANADHVSTTEYMLTQIPEVRISNFGFRNTNGLQFEDVTEEWGLKTPSFSSGAAYADLDNDGDLDYVVNNTNSASFVYKNVSSEREGANRSLRLNFEGPNNGIGVIVEAVINDSTKFTWENNPYRGYKSTVETTCHIGLGTMSEISLVKAFWPSGKVTVLKNVKASQSPILLVEKDAQSLEEESEPVNNFLFNESQKIAWKHNERPFLDYNIQNLLPFKLSQQGPGMAVGDVNGDGLDDVFIGGAKYKKGSFLMQLSDGSFEEKDLLPAIDTLRKKSEDTGVLLFDADNDNDLDLYIVSGGNEDYPESESFLDRLYENRNGQFFDISGSLPKLKISGSCVRAGDVDNDGDLDLFVAGRLVSTSYPKATSSYILINQSKNGKIKFNDATSSFCPELNNIGLICDAIWTDFNNDNALDLIALGDFDDIQVFENNGNSLQKVKDSGLENFKGIWSSINGADFDNDGDIDYIVGNIGDNIRFNGTQKEPAVLLSGDFDGNDLYDVIPFHYVKQNEDSKEKALVPYNGKGDISKQLNVLRTRFVDFKAYANATIENVLTEEEMAKATRHELNYSSSSYIENLGNGKFKIKPLPIQVQFAPVNGTIIEDFNLDGNLDVLIVGNNYGNELIVGQNDGMNGVFIAGDGRGNFKNVEASGFYVPGDAKSLVGIVTSELGLGVLAAQNNSSVKFFDTPLEGQLIVPKPLDRRVSYQFKGKDLLRELYYGSSYLSQSTRKMVLSPSASNITLK